jgi:hypothetical protein
VGKHLRMTFDGAFVAAGWTIALVFLVAGGALGLFWSTAAFERWLDDTGRGDARPIEPAVVEGEPASIGEPQAA